MNFEPVDFVWFTNEIDYRVHTGMMERCALPFHKIVQIFFFFFDHQVPILTSDLVENIKMLSEEKIDYYRSSRFGFAIEFFSSLRNLWLMRTFKSSEQLRLEYSKRFFISPTMNVKDILAVVNQNKGQNPLKGQNP